MTGLFHLLFNITSIVIGQACFPLFISLVEYISLDSGLEQKVATAHILFNIMGVLLFLLLVGTLEVLFNKVLPEKPAIGNKPVTMNGL